MMPVRTGVELSASGSPRIPYQGNQPVLLTGSVHANGVTRMEWRRILLPTSTS